MGELGNIDVQNVLIGGASAIAILIFLVQTARESLDLPDNQIPVATLVIALILFLGASFLPDRYVVAIATAISAAAVASFSVRYVKNGQQKNADSGNRIDSLQGHNTGTPWEGSAQGFRSTQVVREERYTDVPNLGNQLPDRNPD